MKISDLPIIMIECLLFTIIIETIVALIMGIRNKRDIINVILVNVLTNPVVVTLPFLAYQVINKNAYKPTLYVLEILVLFIEGFIYHRVLIFKKINPFIISLLLNAASYIIGLFIM